MTDCQCCSRLRLTTRTHRARLLIPESQFATRHPQREKNGPFLLNLLPAAVSEDPALVSRLAVSNLANTWGRCRSNALSTMRSTRRRLVVHPAALLLVLLSCRSSALKTAMLLATMLRLLCCCARACSFLVLYTCPAPPLLRHCRPATLCPVFINLV